MRRMGSLAVMKCFLGVLISLFVLVSLGPVRADLINGQNYVSLIDWARANGLKPAWLTTGDKLVASDRDTRLVFEVDSAQAEINGVEVRLSFPVAKVKGSPLIAQFDLDKSVRPLLYPSRYVKPQKITTICLDPGHGGKDTGNLVNWHKEKTYTLYLAYNLRDQLKQAGFNVILTRTKDEFVELPDRPAAANKRGADLFVSLHFNATGSGKADVNGAETYCITPAGASSSNAQGEGRGSGATTANRYENQSLLLAYQVQKSLGRNLGVVDRGVRRARFAVLRDAAMPSILIEGGYMTHPVEGEKIYSATYRRQMAAAIARGIIAYQKLTAPPIAPRNYTSK
jgi:N-acetylmuramoyl-L-alanine amidase